MTDTTMGAEPSSTFTRLSKWYPKAFGTVRPLAPGITHDLIRDCLGQLGHYDIVLFMRAYCERDQYLECLQAGAVRVNLKGEPCGVVSKKQAERAAAMLAECAAREKILSKSASRYAKEPVLLRSGRGDYK